MKRWIRGATVIRPEGVLREGAVAIEGASITNVITSADATRPAGEPELDASGLILAPAFIELQINGGFGYDVTRDPQAIWKLGARLPEVGVAAFLPTVISSPAETIVNACDVLRAGPPEDYTGAVPLGLHLEGPFLSPERRGAHDPGCLRLPDPAEARAWTPANGVRMVTLAPELPRALELIRQLVDQDVAVALGHSTADLDTARSGIDAGSRYGTHLFNAMSGLDHHAPGLAAALLGDERATVGVIADGIHVHPELIRLAYRLAGPERFSLVSDAIAGLGMPPGTYPLGSRETIVSDTAATLADGTLAGSVLRLNRAVSNLVAFTGCTLESAVEAVTLVPARLLRIDQRRGSIRPGAMADLVLLTKSLDIVATLVAGEIAYATERVPRWD